MAAPRPLKRPRLGQPDVYPQDSKQREDELTEENVKKGFSYQPLPFSSGSVEYGSAKDIMSNVPLSKFAQSFSSILIEKQKQNTFTSQDGNKRKPQPAKDNFQPVHVTARSRGFISTWFQDLAGNKPLTILGKKVPIFNKKEEIFSSLCDYSIPMLRAAWFIKISSAYTTGINEAKGKKRAMADPAQDWTHAITKYLKDQLNKIADSYQSHFVGLTSTQHQQRMTPEMEPALRQWNYTVRLSQWLYEESLLDRQEFLLWLLDLLDKSKNADDLLLKFLIPLLLRYVDHLVLSQTLARNLAQVCSRKLSTLYSAAEQMQSEQQGSNNTSKTGSTSVPSPVSSVTTDSSSLTVVNPSQLPVLSQYKTCPQHHALVLALSSVLQTIAICCPGALIWNSNPCAAGSTNNVGNTSNPAGANTDITGSKPVVLGSPLDKLPIAPSAMPLPSTGNAQGSLNAELLSVLLASEEEIKTRSKAIESHWSPDKYQDKSSVLAVKRVLNTLEILDRYNFNRADSNSSIDSLYSKIFADSIKTGGQASGTDEAIALLLFEWAVSKYRVGKFRALAVAKVLQKRQAEILDERERSSVQGEEGTSSNVVSGMTSSIPPFQKVLMNFLDNYAPVVDGSYQHNKAHPSFAQLTLLFGELIRNEVFSHNAYMCSLISRGDLQPTPPVSIPSPPRPATTSTEHPPEVEPLGIEECVQEGDATGGIDIHSMTCHEDIGRKESTSDSEQKMTQQMLDQELQVHQERLLQLLDQGDNEIFMDPEAPILNADLGAITNGNKMETSLINTTPLSSSDQRDSSKVDSACNLPKRSQHAQYVQHFPIPSENLTAHENNQRLILLFGVGKGRSQAMGTTKEVTKALCAMLSDLARSDESGLGVDATQNVENLVLKKERDEKKAALYNKFSSLTCFDQYLTVAKCVNVLRDQKAKQPKMFGLVSPTPTFNQLEFLYDLFELSGDVHGLLDFVTYVLMPSEEDISTTQVALVKTVVGTLPTKSVIVVAMLRKYHACLMLLPEHATRIFRGLLAAVENIAYPGICSSPERCILAFLFDLYSSCAHLRVKYADIFSTAYTKIKQAVCSSTTPSACTEPYDPKFMAEYFQNPRTKRLDGIWEHLLIHDKPSDVYSFVCNAMMNVCNCQNSERLYDIGVLCAEVTAHHGRLSSEWLGVLRALCCSSNSSSGFVDLLLEVDVGDLSIHELVATFTALLIARSCFSLEDVIYHVALPSLLAALPSGAENQDAEPGARLTCHLLLRLLDESTDFMSYDHSSALKFPFRMSPDHHLLSAAHESIRFGPLLAVFKAMLKLSEAGRTGDGGSASAGDSTRDDTFRSLFSNRLDDFMDSTSSTGDIFPPPLASSRSAMETSNTSAFAGFALQVICRQEWVREKCLEDPQMLCSPELLLDPAISSNQARKLLHLICYPAGVPSSIGGLIANSNDMETVHEAASRILQNLDQWSLRKSWLELQLMIKQASKEETGPLLDAIATSAMSVFVQRHDTTPLATAHSNQKSVVIKGPEWLVAPLISKLSNLVQGRLLKAAGEVLDTKQWWKEHPAKSSVPTLVHTQPFLSLVLACLKGQEDQREGLLSSIHRQLTQLLAAPAEERCPIDSKSKEVLQEALHLRISLLGAMFDTIQRSSQLSSDWATLLFQLVSSGTITADSLPTKKELLTNVLDMVSVLISVVSNTESTHGQSADESRKAVFCSLQKA